MYEEMSRHLKRNGLGELPIPELLERETIKRLNDETNLFIDPSFRIISRMRGGKSWATKRTNVLPVEKKTGMH